MQLQIYLNSPESAEENGLILISISAFSNDFCKGVRSSFVQLADSRIISVFMHPNLCTTVKFQMSTLQVQQIS